MMRHRSSSVFVLITLLLAGCASAPKTTPHLTPISGSEPHPTPVPAPDTTTHQRNIASIPTPPVITNSRPVEIHTNSPAVAPAWVSLTQWAHSNGFDLQRLHSKTSAEYEL